MFAIARIRQLGLSLSDIKYSLVMRFRDEDGYDLLFFLIQISLSMDLPGRVLRSLN